MKKYIGRIMDLIFYFLFVFVLCVACQTPTANAPQTQAPVQLGEVFAEGTCRGSLRMDLRVGPLALPIVADLDTHASPDGATGLVSLDLGGLLQARCEVFKGVADCKTSGILAPPRQMPVTQNPAPASEGGQPDATTP